MKQLTFEQIENQIAKMREGQVMLVSIRPVSGEKFSVEIAEKISNPNVNSLLGNLNFDDERFSGQKARRGWTSATKSGLLNVFGINLDELKAVETEKFEKVYPVGLMNPKAAGKSVKLQIVDRLGSELDPEKDEWKINNVRESAKQDNKGNYFVHHGELIFSDAIPTDAAEVEHRIIKRTGTTMEPESLLIPDFVVTSNVDEEEEVEEGQTVKDTAKSTL